MNKLTTITGYGEYKLGMRIPRDYLGKFLHRRCFPRDWEGERYGYSISDKFKAEGCPELSVWLSLFPVNGRLEAVVIEFNDLQKHIPDCQALSIFIMKLRRMLLDKYSTKLLISDTFSEWDGIFPKAKSLKRKPLEKELRLKDKKANLLNFRLGVYEKHDAKEGYWVSLSIEYTTNLYRHDSDESKL